LDNIHELSADRILWRGRFVTLRTTLVHATDDDLSLDLDLVTAIQQGTLGNSLFQDVRSCADLCFAPCHVHPF